MQDNPQSIDQTSNDNNFVEKTLMSKRKYKIVNDKVQCIACNRNFKNKHSLKNHFVKKHADLYKNTKQCNVCKKRFFRNKNYEKHMQTHDGDKRFICNICNQEFSSESERKNHQTSRKKCLDSELDIKWVNCTICDKNSVISHR